MGSGFLFEPVALPHWRTNMSHKYKIRQMVCLIRTSISDSRADGSSIYEVVRLMPPDEAGEVSHRIRLGMTERAVRQSEIRA